MKKLLSIICIICIVSVFFVSCNGQKVETENTTSYHPTVTQLEMPQYKRILLTEEEKYSEQPRSIDEIREGMMLNAFAVYLTHEESVSHSDYRYTPDDFPEIDNIDWIATLMNISPVDPDDPNSCRWLNIYLNKEDGNVLIDTMNKMLSDDRVSATGFGKPVYLDSLPAGETII